MAQPARTRVRRAALLASAAAIGWVAARRGAITPVRVEGDSMEPTLPAGALVAVAPVRRDPGIGAVVVVRRPGGAEHLKRVVAGPGDAFLRGGVRMTLAAGEFAVAGDNRERSTDSRDYGPVSREDLAGVARACYWPPSRWRLLPSRG